MLHIQKALNTATPPPRGEVGGMEARRARSIIPAAEWKGLNALEILQSIEVATRVLKERPLADDERKYAFHVAKCLVDSVVR